MTLLLCACATGRPNPAAAAEAFLIALDEPDPNIAQLFTDDATVFFPLNDKPVRANGRAEIAGAFQALFGPDSRGGLPKPENLRVQRLGDVAIVTFENTNPHVTARRTLVLRWETGRWLIAHLHGSNVRKD